MWATGPGQTKVSTQTGIALQGLVPGYVTNVAKVDEKKNWLISRQKCVRGETEKNRD